MTTQQVNTYRASIKSHVSFTSLKQLQQFEPEIFKQFKQIKEGERVETVQYSYRLRDSRRFDLSVTSLTKGQQSQLQPQHQQQQQSNKAITPIKKSILQRLRYIEFSINELTALVEGNEI